MLPARCAPRSTLGSLDPVALAEPWMIRLDDLQFLCPNQFERGVKRGLCFIGSNDWQNECSLSRRVPSSNEKSSPTVKIGHIASFNQLNTFLISSVFFVIQLNYQSDH